MSAGQGPTFPGAGQGNWWERANYGGQGQAPAAPGGAGGMVTGYPGSTPWFQSQQQQYPNTAPGGTDWLRNLQQVQQYAQQQQGPGAGLYGGGLGYGQQGGLAAPALGQQQGGLYGTGGGYLRGGAPPGFSGPNFSDMGPSSLPGYGQQQGSVPGQSSTTSGGTGMATGTAPSWLTTMNQQLPAGYTASQMAQAPADQQQTGLDPNVPWQGPAWYRDQVSARDAAGTSASSSGAGGSATASGSAAPNKDQPVNVAMQNGRPPTSQVTTAAQLATTPLSPAAAGSSSTAPDASTATGSIGGGTGATGAGPVRQINEALVKAYYTNKNPGAFWQQAGQILAGGDRQFENYFVQNFDRYMAQYLQAAEQDQNLQLSDWLTGAEGAQIRNDYLMQAPELRGLDYRRSDPGRFDMRY